MNERIKELRKLLNLSQAKFSEKLGLTAGFINDIEHDRSKVSNQTIKLLTFVFNINEEWLRTGIGEMFNTAEVKETSELEQLLEKFPDEGLSQVLEWINEFKVLQKNGIKK